MGVGPLACAPPPCKGMVPLPVPWRNACGSPPYKTMVPLALRALFESPVPGRHPLPPPTHATMLHCNIK